MPPAAPHPIGWMTVEGLALLAVLLLLLLIAACLLLYAVGRLWHAGAIFKIVIVLVTGALAIAIARRVNHDRGAEANMARLLAGDTGISLTSLETPTGPWRVRCTDADVLRYLTGCIRSNSTEGGAGGRTQEASFGFSDGTVFDTVIYMSPGRFSLSLPGRALEPGFPTHDVKFASPVPKKVDALFRFLQTNIDEVRDVAPPNFDAPDDGDGVPSTQPRP